MKIHLLFVLLILFPLVSAEENLFEEGVLSTYYPETANPGEEVTVEFIINLESNGIKSFELPISGENFVCEEMSCEASHTFIMSDYPLTILAILELEQPKPEEEAYYDIEADFLWTEVNSGQTSIYIKRFTILPSIPQSEIIESTPFLDDEIVDKVNLLTERTIDRIQYESNKENGKYLSVTKQVDYKIVNTSQGKTVRSVWTIKLEPGEEIDSAKNVYVYEEVPKEGAATDNEIIGASHKFTVLRSDPLIMWHFEEVSEPVEITYETKKASITGAATVVTAEEVDKGTIWHIILPIILIPVIGFLLIFFGRYKKE